MIPQALDDSRGTAVAYREPFAGLAVSKQLPACRSIEAGVATDGV